MDSPLASRDCFRGAGFPAALSLAGGPPVLFRTSPRLALSLMSPSSSSTHDSATQGESAAPHWVPQDQLRADVLIIGAGPAGAAAAYHAARAGWDTLVIDMADHATEPRDKTCGDGLTPRAVGALEAMGAGHLLDGHPQIKGLKLRLRRIDHRALAGAREIPCPWLRDPPQRFRRCPAAPRNRRRCPVPGRTEGRRRFGGRADGDLPGCRRTRREGHRDQPRGAKHGDPHGIPRPRRGRALHHRPAAGRAVGTRHRPWHRSPQLRGNPARRRAVDPLPPGVARPRGHRAARLRLDLPPRHPHHRWAGGQRGGCRPHPAGEPGLWGADHHAAARR